MAARAGAGADDPNEGIALEATGADAPKENDGVAAACV